jgi:hypothetical protein
MGCLICFHCEKKLLRGMDRPPARNVRLRLNRLYGKGRAEVFPFCNQ